MSKIQDVFKELLKDTVSPKLRELGLSGSGQNYAIKSEDYWALLSFQKSVYSDSAGLKFTVNLYVVKKTDWNEERMNRSYYPEKPTATVHWAVGWNCRLGKLLPGNSDYWWSLDATSDCQRTASEVIASIADYAIPAMREQMK